MFLVFTKLHRWGIRGMALYPFIIAQDKDAFKDLTFLNHERIHLRQQAELLFIFFYLWYVADYVVLRFKYDHKKAYRNIVFEKEAYQQESQLNYLKQRKFWAFLNYYDR